MSIHWLGRVVLGATLALTVVGCGKDGEGGNPKPTVSDCERLAPQLQSALEEAATAEELSGVTASLRLQDCTWQGATGSSLLSPATAIKAEDRLRAGSITKTFVSVVALQLQAEGKLSLETPLATWFPDFPRADRITVRQLLNHTSGAFNLTRNPDFFAQAMADPGKVWTPEELIAFGAARSPAFEPGARWEYSNTNYILVGAIIEKVTLTPLAQQLRTRIFQPLDLQRTGLDGAEPLPALTVHGYLLDPQDGSWRDRTGLIHPSAGGAAGALVSSADDLSRFYQALFGGALLAPAQLTEMTGWVPTQRQEMPGYGLGLMQFATAVGPGYGHIGDFLGFSAAATYLDEKKATVAVMINREDANHRGVTQRLVEVLATQ